MPSNPDTKTTSTSSVMVYAFPAGILIALIILLLFIYKDILTVYGISFTLLLWIGIPMIVFFMTVGINFMEQSIYCGNTDSSKAFLGGIPSIIATYIGLYISYISFFRIPVISIVTPYFNIKSSTTKCCNQDFTLEGIEKEYPVIQGYAYSFYLLFSTMFGIIFGKGVATVC
jgi:hypothetical protein